eukprot:g16756.t1
MPLSSPCCQVFSAVSAHSAEVVFDTCLLAIAAGHIFSVLAVVSLPQVANPEAPTVPSSAALRFKAAEIHVALSTGELGEEIKKLATHSAESRGEKVSDYTLSSCLTEEAAALRLPLEMASPTLRILKPYI